MNRPLFRMALMLGLISAIGPFAVDMYLPALPAIGTSLKADPYAVQLSLMSFFVSFGVSQIVYGPASDIFGRKPPLYFGIGLFVVGSIGCALAPDVGWLIAFRFVQGLGAGAPMVVPRAIVRDLHTGAEATRLIAMLMLVFSISPVLAPLIGSLVIESAGWRAIFWIVATIGAGGLVMLAVGLPETRSPAQRATSSFGSTLRAFGLLIRDRRFVGLTAIGTFGIATFFIYLAKSSFVLIDHYGLTPRQYGLAFGVNAIGFFGGSQLAGRFAARHGLPRTIANAALGFSVVMCSLLITQLAGIDRLGVMIPMLLAGFAFLGVILPTTAVLALDAHGRIAGAASALMGTVQLVTGAVVIALMSGWVDGTARPMLAGIALASLLTACLSQWTLGRTPRGRSAAPLAAGDDA